MYAKLVVGNTDIPAIGAMRDICRLLTSENPSTEDLLWFDSDVSIIVDETPAGWSYAGGNYETLATGISTDVDVTSTGYVANQDYIMGLVSNIQDSTTIKKYVGFAITWLNGTQANNNRFAMFAAEEITSDGTLTNPGPVQRWDAAQGETEAERASIRSIAGAVLHLIATPRGIVLIENGRGATMVFETTWSSAHRFFQAAPVVQYNHCDTSGFAQSSPITFNMQTVTQATNWQAVAVNVRDINAGVSYGTYDITSGATKNLGFFVQNASDLRQNSITESGLPLYQIAPIFLQLGTLGYPVQYVTGIFPAYWTAPKIGATGDSIVIGAEEYLFFDCGPGFGMAIQTS